MPAATALALAPRVERQLWKHDQITALAGGVPRRLENLLERRRLVSRHALEVRAADGDDARQGRVVDGEHDEILQRSVFDQYGRVAGDLPARAAISSAAGVRGSAATVHGFQERIDLAQETQRVLGVHIVPALRHGHEAPVR